MSSLSLQPRQQAAAVQAPQQQQRTEVRPMTDLEAEIYLSIFSRVITVERFKASLQSLLDMLEAHSRLSGSRVDQLPWRIEGMIQTLLTAHREVILEFLAEGSPDAQYWQQIRRHLIWQCRRIRSAVSSNLYHDVAA